MAQTHTWPCLCVPLAAKPECTPGTRFTEVRGFSSDRCWLMAYRAGSQDPMLTDLKPDENEQYAAQRHAASAADGAVAASVCGFVLHRGKPPTRGRFDADLATVLDHQERQHNSIPAPCPQPGTVVKVVYGLRGSSAVNAASAGWICSSRSAGRSWCPARSVVSGPIRERPVELAEQLVLRRGTRCHPSTPM
jgi:hypothetical protein